MSSTSRCAATRATPLGRVAGLLALTVLGASTTLAQVGTSYCTPAVANSTGAPAAISGSGSAIIPSNDFRLTTNGLPQHAAAYFLCSRAQGFTQSPGGSTGSLCLAHPIGRLVGGVVANSGASGIVSVTADLSAMPQPTGSVAVMPSETWNFQCWYRDVAAGGTGATSNFSDGLEVLFTGAPIPISGMVPIPSGTFLMGSNALNGPPYFNDGDQQPVHQVTISYGFWMGQREVTQAEYEALNQQNLSYFTGASRPVERVTWQAARAYCTALTVQQWSLGNVPPEYEYRLPTEAEWEYACRAGTTTEFHYGQTLNCSQAQFSHNYHTNPPTACFPNGTSSVGSFLPNAFGLFDMHGNVWEWCLDSFSPYSTASVTDPFVTGGPNRVYRGGSWLYYSGSCRSACRADHVPGFASYDLGFRVVLAPVLVP